MTNPETTRRVSLGDLRLHLGAVARQTAASRQPLIITDHGTDLVRLSALDYVPEENLPARPGDLNVKFVCQTCGCHAGFIGTAEEAEAHFAERLETHLDPEHRFPRLVDDEQPIPFPHTAA